LLLNGPYPTYLKERILSPKGHQSNVICGQLLAKNWHTEMRNVFLCHLSNENNDPEVAINTIKDILLEEGIMPGEDLFVTPLERTKPSALYTLNENIIR
jgi:phosphoribosyl 1,2-cyclic phosphodiesterase